MNRVFTYNIALMIGLFSIFGSIYAQEHQIVPSTPEASALSKFVNYPIGYNTGIPNISIPLHEIKVGALTLPVAINYHSGGFKINEKSSNVGLGWTLSTDLQISRSIKGMDDFRGNKGYYYKPYTNWEDPYYSPSTRTKLDMLNNVEDHQPDQFTYKLLGKSGTFYFKKYSNGTVEAVTVPYNGIKIEVISKNLFMITDTDGTVYWFGDKGLARTAASTETSGTHSFEYNHLNSIVSWKCTEIESPNKKDAILFQYKDKPAITSDVTEDRLEVYSTSSPCHRDDDQIQFYDIIFPDHPVNMMGYDTYHDFQFYLPQHYYEPYFYKLSAPKYFNRSSGPDRGFYMVWERNGQQQVKQYTIPGNGKNNHVYGVALDKIAFRGGSLTFTGLTFLESIKVKDYKSNEIKTINFNFIQAPYTCTDPGHVSSSYNYGVTKYLESVEITKPTAAPEYYYLEYNDHYAFDNHLKGSDAWGGVNGSTVDGYDGLTSVPSQPVVGKHYTSCSYALENYVFYIGSGNKMVDESKMKAGILNKITYPTGGYTQFEFETNRYKDIHYGLVKLGGGLRIKNIKYFDGKSDRSAFEKIYKYGRDENGAGTLKSIPSLQNPDGGYLFKQTEVHTTYKSNGNSGPSYSYWKYETEEEKTTYLPNTLDDLSYSNGSPMHYSEVAEYQVDKGVQTGKTVFKYEETTSDPSRLVTGTNIKVEKTDWHLGKLQSETYYKYENGDYNWVKEKKFSYYKHLIPSKKISIVKIFQNIIAQTYDHPSPSSIDDEELYNTFYGAFTVIPYFLEVGEMLLTQEEEKWKEGANELSKVTNYFYDNLASHMQVTRTETEAGGYTKIVNYTTYPGDYTASVPFIDQMKEWHMVAVPIENVTTFDRDGANRALSGQIIVYNANNPGLTDRVYGFESAAPIALSSMKLSKEAGSSTVFTNSTISSPYYKEKVAFEYVGSYGTPSSVKPKDNNVKSYLWGYQYLYPLAECTNALQGEFFYDGFEEFTSATFGDAHTGEFFYDSSINGGFTTSNKVIPGLNGRTYVISYWSLDANNKWVYSGEQAYSGQTLTGIIDDVRIYPIDAELTSYTYEPLIGMTSAIDAKGLTTYYDYKFGRLSAVRDHAKNIVKTYCYNYAGQVTDCAIPSNLPVFGNYFKVQSFTKYNCPDGENPSVYYTVANNTYTATTQEAANAMAQADIDANGQDYANNYGQCPEATVYTHIWTSDSYYDLSREYKDIGMAFFDMNWNMVSVNELDVNFSYQYENPYKTPTYGVIGYYVQTFKGPGSDDTIAKDVIVYDGYTGDQFYFRSEPGGNYIPFY